MSQETYHVIAQIGYLDVIPMEINIIVISNLDSKDILNLRCSNYKIHKILMKDKIYEEMFRYNFPEYYYFIINVKNIHAVRPLWKELYFDTVDMDILYVDRSDSYISQIFYSYKIFKNFYVIYDQLKDIDLLNQSPYHSGITLSWYTLNMSIYENPKILKLMKTENFMKAGFSVWDKFNEQGILFEYPDNIIILILLYIRLLNELEPLTLNALLFYFKWNTDMYEKLVNITPKRILKDINTFKIDIRLYDPEPEEKVMLDILMENLTERLS